jgi:hypothetical protein
MIQFCLGTLGNATSVVKLSVSMLGVIMLIVMALSSDVCLEKTLISINYLRDIYIGPMS